MTPFSFEEKVKIKHEDYVAMHSLFRKKSATLRRMAALVVGIVCLLWSVTLLFGIVLIVLVVVSAVIPSVMPWAASDAFRSSPYLHAPVTFGANEECLWARGATFEARFHWSLLHVWDERDGWLWLASTGLPELYFRVASLRDAGVYEQMLELASKSAPRFNGTRPPTNDSSGRGLSQSSENGPS